MFEDHGLKLTRLVTSLSEADSEAERLLETIRKVGVEKIRIDSYDPGPDPLASIETARRKLSALERLLEKHGVRGAIQNRSGNTLAVNIGTILLQVRDCDPEWIGIQYDPGHCTISGEPVKLAIGLMGPRLHSVNMKNPRQEPLVDPKTGRLVFRQAWVPLRDGMVDIPFVLAELKAAGYTDPLSIHAEYGNCFSGGVKDVDVVNRLVAADLAYVREILRNL